MSQSAPWGLLHHELARNPEFFTEVVSWVFSAEDEESVEVSEEVRKRAQFGYDLLDSWRTVPGVWRMVILMAIISGIGCSRRARPWPRVGVQQTIGHVLSGSPAALTVPDHTRRSGT
jgi:hypothetical protein